MSSARLLTSPSKTLLKFVDQIASSGPRPVLDAPCGYGRNSIALAARGCTVLGVDNDWRRLTAIEQAKCSSGANGAPPFNGAGRIFTVCANLKNEFWPFAPSSFSTIVCIHFPMTTTLVQRFIFSLQPGGYIYVETFGGHGENFRELPSAGQLKTLFSGYVDFKYYNERRVGPREFNRVSVVLFAKRR
jgi:SAM-dependent methyltransferase